MSKGERRPLDAADRLLTSGRMEDPNRRYGRAFQGAVGRHSYSDGRRPRLGARAGHQPHGVDPDREGESQAGALPGRRGTATGTGARLAPWRGEARNRDYSGSWLFWV